MRIIAIILLLCISLVPATVILGDNTQSTVETVVIETTKETLPIEPTSPTILETTPIIETTPEITEPIGPVTKTLEEVEKEWAEEATYIAKTVWGEARGISVEEQEKVIWCILNRVDCPRYPDTIKGVVTSGAFYGYYKSNPIWEEHYNLALEVIAKWLFEKEGGEIERLLESDYY
jgi:hypothetical protein